MCICIILSMYMHICVYSLVIRCEKKAAKIQFVGFLQIETINSYIGFWYTHIHTQYSWIYGIKFSAIVHTRRMIDSLHTHRQFTCRAKNEQWLAKGLELVLGQKFRHFTRHFRLIDMQYFFSYWTDILDLFSVEPVCRLMD